MSKQEFANASLSPCICRVKAPLKSSEQVFGFGWASQKQSNLAHLKENKPVIFEPSPDFQFFKYKWSL